MKTIPILAVCIIIASSITKAGEMEQAEQRFREALINYKQNATFRADRESISFDLDLLRQASTAANAYDRASQSPESCVRQLIQPIKELEEAEYVYFQATLSRDMARGATLQPATTVKDQAAAKYQHALRTWQTAITVCPQAVNPYLLQGGNP